MNDILDFIQSYWFELGSLTLLLAILSAVVAYGRRLLRVLSAPLVASSVASRAQVEFLQDLQRLSETQSPRQAAEARISEPKVAEPRVAEPKAALFGGVGRMFGPATAAPARSDVERHVAGHMEAAEAMVARQAEAAGPSRREGPSRWKALKTWLNTPWGVHAGVHGRQASA
ncbi:MAG TPA: hypothetical protein VJN21_11765 [Candidatus Acidoferrales bacterium]|nr:hypothetical protein [Candidatus Acidoferrales bacterium]